MTDLEKKVNRVVKQHLSDFDYDELIDLLVQLEEKSHINLDKLKQSIIDEFELTREEIVELVTDYYKKKKNDDDFVDFMTQIMIIKSLEQKRLNQKLKDYQRRAKALGIAFDKDLQNDMDKSLNNKQIKSIDTLMIPVRCVIDLLYGGIEKDIEKELRAQAKDAVNQAGYLTFHTTGVGFDITIDLDKLLKQTNNPDGSTWQDSLFYRKRYHQQNVSQAIKTNIGTRGGLDRVVDMLDGNTQSRVRAVNTDLQTKATFYRSISAKETYKAIGFDSVEFVATLDNRTSDMCREADGTIIPIDAVEPGENAPPLHTYCRSVLVAHFDDENLPDVFTRSARDETNHTYFVDADLTYEEWVKTRGITE